VIVAVAAVRMVEVTVDQVVDVIAVRHRLVAARRAMLVSRAVRAAVVGRRASGRIGRPDFENVFVHVIAVGRVQMAVVEVVDVILVADGGVAAAGAMNVRMASVDSVAFHVFRNGRFNPVPVLSETELSTVKPGGRR
jgi:hypothetical protein